MTKKSGERGVVAAERDGRAPVGWVEVWPADRGQGTDETMEAALEVSAVAAWWVPSRGLMLPALTRPYDARADRWIGAYLEETSGDLNPMRLVVPAADAQRAGLIDAEARRAAEREAEERRLAAERAAAEAKAEPKTAPRPARGKPAEDSPLFAAAPPAAQLRR